MCGIAGIVEPGAPAERLLEPARALAGHLRHRGPDGRGEWSETGVALEHCRLAILDPSPRGAQPMRSPDGRWVLVHNGELYNHREVRAALSGPWAGGSDAETLVRALAADGVAAVERFAGMFAVAAWDREARTLHLVRDRIGIKPLYYLVDGDTVAFASEPGALAATYARCRRLDRDALASYLAVGYPPVGSTLFRDIRVVRPGEVVSVRAGAITARRYWRLPEACEPARPEAEWLERFGALWPEVARAHCLADVPVGLFLSSGLDSSAVAAAVAAEHPAPRAYTAGFPERAYDETEAAEAFCRRLGLPFTALEVDGAAVEKLLPQLARHADLPVCDSSAIGTWLLCGAAAREVKVALSGDGADEVFGGYPTHRATEWLASPLGRLARALSGLVGDRVPAPRPSAARVSAGQKLTRFLRYARHGPLPGHLRWRTLIDPAALRALAPDHADPWGPWEALLAAYPEQPLGNRVLAADVEGYLVQNELARLDRMGMAHGLELRVPFLDHRLVELAFRMPYAVKCRGGRGKRPIAWWLRRQGHGDVADRPKRGFNHPVAAWFAGPLGERLLDALDRSRLAPLLRKDPVERWVRRHRQRQEDRAYELWTVLFLLEWAEAHDVGL